MSEVKHPWSGQLVAAIACAATVICAILSVNATITSQRQEFAETKAVLARLEAVAEERSTTINLRLGNIESRLSKLEGRERTN